MGAYEVYCGRSEPLTLEDLERLAPTMTVGRHGFTEGFVVAGSSLGIGIFPLSQARLDERNTRYTATPKEASRVPKDLTDMFEMIRAEVATRYLVPVDILERVRAAPRGLELSFLLGSIHDPRAEAFIARLLSHEQGYLDRGLGRFQDSNGLRR
jgi:hypothetical protein